MAQNTSSAVMQQRHEAPDSLEYFPTPPWATRALCEHLEKWGGISKESVWEPACGEGHMARPLAEYFAQVTATDVHDYSETFPDQVAVKDFLLRWSWLPRIDAQGVDWIITNPPFRLAEEFARLAIAEARVGVALLVRSAFLEGEARWRDLFSKHPPEWILQFTQRVPMFQGRIDPKGRSATAYCWIVWLAGRPIPAPGAEYDPTHFPAFVWIPPCRDRLIRPEDYAVAAPAEEPGPLFAEPTP